MAEVRVLVDGMLGRLARWLRLLGLDVEYGRDMEDDELIRRAVEEGRVLLTRDTGLHSRALKAGVRSLLVPGDTEAERIAWVSERLGVELEVDPSRSRCPSCGARIRRVDKSSVASLVPPKVYEAHDEFWVCTGCGKVYWRGSHWVNMERMIREARRIRGLE
mgnify:FL=1